MVDGLEKPVFKTGFSKFVGDRRRSEGDNWETEGFDCWNHFVDGRGKMEICLTDVLEKVKSCSREIASLFRANKIAICKVFRLRTAIHYI
jgi:hypothetical protein